MAMLVLFIITVMSTLRAFVSWRSGILLMIVIAAIQDPLRKLVPGTPGWLVLATAPVFMATIVASIQKTRRWWLDLRQFYPSIAKSLLLLIVLSLPAAAISATYSDGSWMLTVLGAFSYSVIFLAIIAGFHYPRSLQELRKVLSVYCIAHGLMLTGGLLQFLNVFPGASVLGTKALGYEWIRWGAGYTVDLVAGFYRSADVMGWHAAAVCMISLVLARTSRGSRRHLWILLSVFAMLAVFLCGRRKMVYMLPVFGLALTWVYWQAGRAGQVVAIMGLVALPLASVLVVGDWLGEQSANVRYYQGIGTNDSTIDRFETLGFHDVYDTFDQSGFFGEGLGTATPGSHNLEVERPKVWQESTSSRILVELGVPGALGFLAVMAAIVYALWRVSMVHLRAKTPQSPYVAGLLAFFIANVGALLVSGQILADPFIAAFLGFLVGLTLSASRIPTSQSALSSSGVRATIPQPALRRPMPR